MGENLDQAIESLRLELVRLDAVIAAVEALASGQHNAPDFHKQSKRGRKSMSMEERLDVSARMKKYWAERRARKQLQPAG
jgi:hypothetical protein